MSESGRSQVSKSDIRNRMQNRYDRLWRSTVGKIRAGKIDRDPVLAAGRPDRRRGLTLIARPASNVRKRIAAFLGQLRDLEPEQYYYAPAQLHLTLLSLFTATVEHARFFAKTEQYMAAVDVALRKAAPIRIQLNGVTSSPGAIMIQGFVENDALNEVRDALRGQLRVRGLVDGVDTRYRLQTAHITVVRFRARLQDGEQLAAMLERERNLSFGIINVRSVSLVRNDWYMTRRVVKTVERYHLPPRRNTI
jgi:2'-5' RNA ligase